jgi:hypothetical protein
MKIKFIAPASDFASTKYTPSQRPPHHFCCECARASHHAFGQADLTRSACVFAIVATRRNALLHAGAATRLNMCSSLPYYLR